MSEEWTQERLDERLAYWQKVLRLRDWDVKVSLERGYQMPGQAGATNYTQSLQVATIRLMDPNDNPDPDWPADVERTLVHELLHLHFAPFMKDADNKDDPEYIAQEVAIEQMSKALVALERR